MGEGGLHTYFFNMFPVKLYYFPCENRMAIFCQTAHISHGFDSTRGLKKTLLPFLHVQQDSVTYIFARYADCNIVSNIFYVHQDSAKSQVKPYYVLLSFYICFSKSSQLWTKTVPTICSSFSDRRLYFSCRSFSPESTWWNTRAVSWLKDTLKMHIRLSSSKYGLKIYSSHFTFLTEQFPRHSK